MQSAAIAQTRQTEAAAVADVLGRSVDDVVVVVLVGVAIAGAIATLMEIDPAKNDLACAFDVAMQLLRGAIQTSSQTTQTDRKASSSGSDVGAIGQSERLRR